jgi:uncharacterized protein YdeI (YjbR/CyaY-like superfamily)
MPPVIPDPARIRAFPTEAAFERWLRANHAREPELWLKVHKKGAGLPTVTYAQAVDVALCWGWIDGLKKSFDEASFLQRFTPRRPKSVWSQVNRRNVERLVAAGRMTPHGQRHVDEAKQDGRWERAYASGASMAVPDDLAAAIAASPKARATYATLDRANLYAIAWRTETKKTAAGRAKTIAGIVALLAKGGTLHPMK